MKIIPTEYQELEAICESITKTNARCIACSSPLGKAGTSSLVISIAKRLSGRNQRVLIIDLNTCHPLNQQEYASLPAQLPNWSFSDISCQLNTQEIENFYFLSVNQLQDLALVREKDVFSMAVLMLQQEFDYILFDMSPICKKNKANFPLQLLLSVTDLTLVEIALGETKQEELDHVVMELKKSACKHIEFVATQMYMPPLGELLVSSINNRFAKLPKLKRRLLKLVERQAWLFQGV